MHMSCSVETNECFSNTGNIKDNLQPCWLTTCHIDLHRSASRVLVQIHHMVGAETSQVDVFHEIVRLLLVHVADNLPYVDILSAGDIPYSPGIGCH